MAIESQPTQHESQHPPEQLQQASAPSTPPLRWKGIRPSVVLGVTLVLFAPVLATAYSPFTLKLAASLLVKHPEHLTAIVPARWSLDGAGVWVAYVMLITAQMHFVRRAAVGQRGAGLGLLAMSLGILAFTFVCRYGSLGYLDKALERHVVAYDEEAGRWSVREPPCDAACVAKRRAAAARANGTVEPPHDSRKVEARLAAGRTPRWWNDRLRQLASRSDPEGKRLFELTRERGVRSGVVISDGQNGPGVSSTEASAPQAR
jgi:hypothetical protein